MRLTQDELNAEYGQYMRIGALNSVDFYAHMVAKFPEVKSVVTTSVGAALLYEILSYRISQDRKNSGLTNAVACATVFARSGLTARPLRATV